MIPWCCFFQQCNIVKLNPLIVFVYAFASKRGANDKRSSELLIAETKV